VGGVDVKYVNSGLDAGVVRIQGSGLRAAVPSRRISMPWNPDFQHSISLIFENELIFQGDIHQEDLTRHQRS